MAIVAEEQRPGESDPVQRFGEIRSVGGPGRIPGMKTALLGDDVCLLLRVECDRGIEVGEEDDEDRVEED